jgi:hypothetical protein
MHAKINRPDNDNVVSPARALPEAQESNSLDDLELPFDEFAANEEAQVILPKPAKPPDAVHKKLEAENLPQTQQFDVNALFAKTGGRVIIVFVRIVAEKPK